MGWVLLNQTKKQCTVKIKIINYTTINFYIVCYAEQYKFDHTGCPVGPGRPSAPGGP